MWFVVLIYERYNIIIINNIIEYIFLIKLSSIYHTKLPLKLK